MLIPVYNRKHYIAQCLDSALNQTFKDYEIIVRDDGSSDGSADFVQEKYAAQIKSGKLKLRRNERNLGEFPTVNKLIREATGKYYMILHSDDMYLPQAVEQMYSVAEHFQADVVHGCRFLNSPKDGVITQGTQLQISSPCRAPVNAPTLMPTDKISRFLEWATDGTFLDSQYNIYNRQFVTEKDLFFDGNGTLHLFLLRWLLNAKVFVKVPFIPYVRRDAPDSWSNNLAKFSIEKFISDKIETARRLEVILPELKLFGDNEEIKHLVMLKLLVRSHQIQISGRGLYKEGITPELRSRVEDTFRKYIGDASPYAAILFHMVFMIPTNQFFEQIMLNDGLRKVLASLPRTKT